MSSDLLTTSEPPAGRLSVPGWVYALALAGVGIGALAFALVAASAHPAAAWRALLINFLLWTSLAQGGVVWAAIFRTARTTWSAPVNRLGHAASWFLPFSLLVFAVLFLGRAHFLPWIHQDLGDRRAWLNVPSLFLRDGIGLLVVTLLSFTFVYTYLRADMSRGQPGGGAGEEAAAVPTGDRLAPDRLDRRLSVLGVVLVIVFAIVYTLVGFDLGMSLNPHWYSVLYGAYFLVGGLYAAMAALIIMAVLLRRWLGVSRHLGPQQFHDLGNLLMAFAMVMTYLFFSQALPIWYENLPGETQYAIRLANFQPWRTLAWTVLGACYLGPFALLVIREMKRNPRTLVCVAALVVAAMWLERYVLVAPVLAPRTAAFPAIELLVGLGFIGVFVLTTAFFLSRYPAESRLDLALAEKREAEWP